PRSLRWSPASHVTIGVSPPPMARQRLVTCLLFFRCPASADEKARRERAMVDLNEVKITQRDEQVLKLLVQGCTNKEIASELRISPRTVKQHLRTLFLRAGIKDGRKR